MRRYSIHAAMQHGRNLPKRKVCTAGSRLTLLQAIIDEMKAFREVAQHVLFFQIEEVNLQVGET